MVLCVSCYLKGASNIFQVNDPMDEYGNLIYGCESDASIEKVGMYGSHLMGPFKCDLCVLCTLYHRNPRQVQYDEDNLTITQHMNLYDIWSREPSTTANNLRMMSLLISTCETSGFDPQLLRLGPFLFEYLLGFTVAFSMLSHYLQLGRHSSNYIQFSTIRNQRSAYSNEYLTSQ